MIHVRCEAATLHPRSQPEDMEKLNALYSFLDERLEGLEAYMDEIPCEKLIITIDHTEKQEVSE